MINSLDAPVQFCESCKNLLLDSALCARCGFENRLVQREMTIEKKYAGSKNWTQKMFKAEKEMMNMDCPKCDAKEMYFSSRQMRSADEGETVFLECGSCGYKSVN